MGVMLHVCFVRVSTLTGRSFFFCIQSMFATRLQFFLSNFAPEIPAPAKPQCPAVSPQGSRHPHNTPNGKP